MALNENELALLTYDNTKDRVEQFNARVRLGLIRPESLDQLHAREERIPSDGCQRMSAVACSIRVPGNGKRRCRVFGSEVIAIQKELHAHDTDVVCGVRSDGDCPADVCVPAGSGYRNSRHCVVHCHCDQRG